MDEHFTLVDLGCTTVQAHQLLAPAVDAFAKTGSLRETDVMSIPWLNMSALGL